VPFAHYLINIIHLDDANMYFLLFLNVSFIVRRVASPIEGQSSGS